MAARDSLVTALIILVIAMAAESGGTASAPAAPLLNFVPVDAPEAQGTFATGINEAGQIVGYSIDRSGQYHGFVLSRGTFKAFDLPVPGTPYPQDINDSGQIVGSYLTGRPSAVPDAQWGAQYSSDMRGFLLTATGFTTLAVPDSQSTVARGINSAGQIVGNFKDKGGIDHGFLLRDGTYTNIDVPGAARTYATDINDLGHVVGYFLDPGASDSDGFVLVDGKVQILPPMPGVRSVEPDGINSAGQIVGRISDSGLAAFWFEDGKYSRVGYPGAHTSAVWGINNTKQIVGHYLLSIATYRGFTARPK